MSDTSLIVGSLNRRHIDSKDWSKQSLRQCLNALGVSDSEMRFSRNLRSIMQAWEEDAQVLFDLVKKKWKSQVVLHHEANGGDPEQWKNINCLYSEIVKRISRSLPKFRRKTITYECIICHRYVTKVYVSRFQEKACLCGRRKCYLKHRSIRGAILRRRYQVPDEVICENPECKKRFFPVGKARGKTRFCSKKCWRKIWCKKNADLLKKWNKQYAAKRPLKVRFASWTEEHRQDYRMRRTEARHRWLANETPEHKKERLERIRVKMKEYRDRRKAEGRPIGRIDRLAWLAKKKVELIDKPWIYETLVQKYQHECPNTLLLAK